MQKIIELNLNEVETVTGGASNRPAAAEMTASYSHRPTSAASAYRPATFNGYNHQASNIDAMIAQYKR